MYQVFLGTLQLPITPGKIKMKINNKNETVDLINEGEINILKSPGLTEINFEFMIPRQKYPFSNLTGSVAGIPLLGGASTKAILDYIENLKINKTPVQFIVVRTVGEMSVSSLFSGSLLNTNITVAVEDYSIDDDVDNGFDLMVDINLKQYKSYSTKILNKDGTVTKTRA